MDLINIKFSSTSRLKPEILLSVSVHQNKHGWLYFPLQVTMQSESNTDENHPPAKPWHLCQRTIRSANICKRTLLPFAQYAVCYKWRLPASRIYLWGKNNRLLKFCFVFWNIVRCGHQQPVYCLRYSFAAVLPTIMRTYSLFINVRGNSNSTSVQ